jgi:hypothetical protein
MSQEPFEEWIDEAASWLAEHVHDHLELEQALRRGLWRDAWHLSAHQGPTGCDGISLVTAAGRWLLEGRTEEAAIHLIALAGKDRKPSALDASEATWEHARPLLAAAGVLGREEERLSRVCRRAPAQAEGRWAAPGDLPFLASCVYPSPGGRDWPALIAARRVALLTRGPGEAACVTVEPATAAYALLGELRASGEAVWRDLGERVVGFAARELLAGRPAVRSLARAGDAAALALLGRAGFEPAGRVHHAEIV